MRDVLCTFRLFFVVFEALFIAVVLFFFGGERE